MGLLKDEGADEEQQELAWMGLLKDEDADEEEKEEKKKELASAGWAMRS